MNKFNGNAIVYCEGAFNTPNGKTAHGLVRFTRRYNVLSVIDSTYQGQDAGMVLDSVNRNIPIFASLSEAYEYAEKNNQKPEYAVIGLAPDGGKLPEQARNFVKNAIVSGLHVDSGLHDFLTEDDNILRLAVRYGVRLRDIRKPKDRSQLHFFTGEIEKVKALKIAVLGTDSAVGKRTTAWRLVHALNDIGINTVMIGTGQTAWLQGANYCIIMDSIVNDFVSGELEYAVVQAWKNEAPDVIIIEGQGSLLNPAYPGGFEILAATRPDYVIMQHAPARIEYDGFPGYALHPLKKQIDAVEVISDKKVIAITINHEGLSNKELIKACEKIENETGLPAVDVLIEGAERIVNVIKNHVQPSNVTS